MSHESFPSSENSSETPMTQVNLLIESAETLVASKAWSEAHIVLCDARKIVIAQQLGRELYDMLEQKLDTIEDAMKTEKEESLRIQREEQAKKPGIVTLEKQSPFIDEWMAEASNEFGYEIMVNEEGSKFIENKKDGLRIALRHTTTTGIATISSIDHPENVSNISFAIGSGEDVKKMFEDLLQKFENQYEQDAPLSEEVYDEQIHYEEQQDQIDLQESILTKGLEHQKAIEEKTKEIQDLMKGEGEQPPQE